VKVIGIEPQPRGVRFVVLVRDRLQTTIPLRESYEFSESEDRSRGISQIRERLLAMLRNQQPDAIAIKQLEQEALRSQKRNVSMGWFHSAELRGMALEVSFSSNVRTHQWDLGTVTRTVGHGRKAAELADDADFFRSTFLSEVPKGFRQAALIALSLLESNP
jgi:hypothetical protein